MSDARPGAEIFDPAEHLDPDRRHTRMLEALLFAAAEPLSEEFIATRLPGGADVPRLLGLLAKDYADRGVQLRRVAGKWMMCTAPDLAHLLRDERERPKALTRAQLETLAIIAYHQPVTRADIEDIRGVSTSKGTLDVLLDTEWIRLRGRRKSPGRPVTYGTTEAFLVHFQLDTIRDLPGLDELRGSGLLDVRLPSGFAIPSPDDSTTLAPDEDPIDEDDPGEPADPSDASASEAETGP